MFSILSLVGVLWITAIQGCPPPEKPGPNPEKVTLAPVDPCKHDVKGKHHDPDNDHTYMCFKDLTGLDKCTVCRCTCWENRQPEHQFTKTHCGWNTTMPGCSDEETTDYYSTGRAAGRTRRAVGILAGTLALAKSLLRIVG